MGEIMAAICVAAFGAMFAFICYYTEKQDRLEQEAEAKAEQESKKKE